MKYKILLLLQATAKWHSLSKIYRNKIFTDVIYPLFLQYSDDLQIQVFNSEAFHASVSDVITIETETLQEYYQFLHEFKSSKIFAEEYFKLQDVITSVENGFKKFNEEAKKKQEYSMN